jgi:flagellar biosynthesis/type III secretory pathway protein FliH
MAVAIGVAAFALGAGSRPSRAEVSNDLMNQRQQLQADADRRATQQEQALRSEFAQTLDATVRHATQRGVARGRRLGFAAGRAQGYGSGHAAGYAAGINAGYSSGQAVGESLGFARGYCASFGPIC